MDPKALGSALKAVRHATGQDGAKLGVVWFEPSHRMYRLIAADNHRLAVAERLDDEARKLTPFAIRSSEVPVLLFWLARAGETQIKIQKGHVAFWDSATALTLEAIDQPCPDWRSVAKSTTDDIDRRSLVVPYDQLKEAADAFASGSGEGHVWIEIGEPGKAVALLSNGYREWIMPVRVESKPQPDRFTQEEPE